MGYALCINALHVLLHVHYIYSTCRCSILFGYPLCFNGFRTGLLAATGNSNASQTTKDLIAVALSSPPLPPLSPRVLGCRRRGD